MSLPVLQPRQNSSLSILPATGTYSSVASALTTGIYSNSNAFITGAVEQVSFVYHMLGGEVLDIEVRESNVYSAYEMSVLEYSYLVNLHQAKNSLGSLLGTPTASFNHDGQITTGSLSGTNAALRYPKFTLSYARNVTDQIAYEAGFGGSTDIHSASIAIVAGTQTYDLSAVIRNLANNGNTTIARAITGSNDGQMRIHKVFYKSPHQTWRFFGYYGGLTVVGNLNTYGQYADDSTFDVIPAWQNKLQAINYRTNLYTRASHYSYDIKNNMLNLYPTPTAGGADTFWFLFSFAPTPLSQSATSQVGVTGVNNLNTLPFENLPYENINSLGKHWIRRYSLAIVKGMLSQTRGKFSVIPIPGESITLNHASLLTQSTEEMDKLREELKQILEDLTYQKTIEREANIMENNLKIQQHIPRLIFVG